MARGGAGYDVAGCFGSIKIEMDKGGKGIETCSVAEEQR